MIKRKYNKGEKLVTSFRLPEELLDKMRELADSYGCSQTDIVRDAVELYLRKLEKAKG